MALSSLAALYYWFWIVTVATAFGPHPSIWRSVIGLLATASLLIALAAWLARRGAWHHQNRFWPALIAAAWALSAASIWYSQCSPFSRDPRFAVVFVATSFWLLWAWLMFFIPWALPAQLAALVALMALVGLYRATIRADGIDGRALPKLAWRFTGGFSSQLADGPGDLAQQSDNQEADADLGEFPCFRGRDGLGVIQDARLDDDWQAHPPKQLWRRGVGAGWSAFAVAGRHAITQEQRGEQECVVCYNRLTGREIWIHRDLAHYHAEGTGDGPRATPCIEGQSVYTLGATGILNALDRRSGTVRWSVNILGDNGAVAPGHGMTGSPLVVDDLVVVAAGGKGASLVAYDKVSGVRRWQGGGDPAGYASPVRVELAGTPQILIVSTQSLVAHDSASGEVLWQIPWRNDQQTNCSQPCALDGNKVFASANYGTGCALFDVRQECSKWTASAIWSSRALQTKFCSAVIRAGYAYGLDDGILECVSLADGRRQWKSGRYGHGQLLLVDERLLIQAEDGRVVLVEATPKRFREQAQFQALEGKTWNYPVLAGRQLFVRNDREAACFMLPEKSE